jgi:hypothetical protein
MDWNVHTASYINEIGYFSRQGISRSPFAWGHIDHCDQFTGSAQQGFKVTVAEVTK